MAEKQAPADDIEVVDEEIVAPVVVVEQEQPKKKDLTDEERTRPQRGQPWRVMDDPTLSDDAKRYIKRQRFHRGEAERRADDAVRERDQLRSQLKQTQDAGLEHYEISVKARVAQAKAALKQAHEAGDADAITTASEQLGAASADAADLVRRKAVQPPAERTQVPRQQFTPRTQEWVDQNPWFQQDAAEFDAEAVRAAVAIAQRIEKQGIKPDTDEYFEELDRRVRRAMPDLLDKASTDDDEEDTTAVTTATTTTPERAARTAGTPRAVATTGKQAASPTRVTLNAEEKALCASMNITPEAYARQKLARSKAEGSAR